MNQSATGPDNWVNIEVRTRYLPDQSSPDDERYAFAYTINIRNEGPEAVRLLNRHWIITDGNEQRQEVRGEGVVGEQPRIEPGQEYEYTSGSLLDTPVGSMEGSYGMITADGTPFIAPIAPFSLVYPGALH